MTNTLDIAPQGIHTILRDYTTPREEFRFFADRLSTLVIETALSHLPTRTKPITTRTGIDHVGQQLDILPGHLCGVSILRSGASLEKGLRRVIRDCPIGSMLIQSERDSGEPLLYDLALPSCITTSLDSASKSFVLLLDAQIGTGAAALMAVRVLLDHGVPEGNILLCTILVSKMGGVWALRAAFPEVRIVSSAADEGLEERMEETKDGLKKVGYVCFIRPLELAFASFFSQPELELTPSRLLYRSSLSFLACTTLGIGTLVPLELLSR